MDILGIYSVKHWQLIHRFNIDFITDLYDILWSDNDQYILCINNSLLYKFVIYTPRGRKVFEYSAYENALGIACFSFSKNNKYLSIGSYDNKIRIFNTMTWRIVAEQSLVSLASISKKYETKSTICYQEVAVNLNVNLKQEKKENEIYQEKTRYVLRDINNIDVNSNNMHNIN
eukprot:UN13141